MRFLTFTAPNDALIDAGRKTQTRRLATPARRRYKPGIYDRCDRTRVLRIEDTYCRVLVEYTVPLLDGGHAPQRWVNVTDDTIAKIRARKDPHAPQPAMFMLSELALRQIRLNSICEEPLGEVSEADAIAEGVERLDGGWRHYTEPGVILEGARESFASLWDSIHGRGAFARQRGTSVLVFDFEPFDAASAAIA